MDQFAVSLCPPAAAMLLDCRSETFERVPLDDPAVSIVVTDSRVTHSLGERGSQYPVRVAQCAAAARALGVPTLRDVASPQALARALAAAELAPEEAARARHVVGENARCVAFAAALRARDYAAAGTAMLASHASLRDDYEVSTPELDALVEMAARVPGVHGSRLTGAGASASVLGAAVYACGCVCVRVCVYGVCVCVCVCARVCLALCSSLYAVRRAHRRACACARVMCP
jgi:galactokinase